MDLFKGGLEPLAPGEAEALIAEALGSEDLDGKSVLFIIPDSTRSFPAPLVFSAIHRALSGRVRSLDFLIALGTHRPMSDAAIRAMLGASEEEMRSKYGHVRVSGASQPRARPSSPGGSSRRKCPSRSTGSSSSATASS
jgi:hypothetical protein